MPTYDYKCNSCGHRFEKRLRFSDNPEANCPTCGSEASRTISLVPVIFKGNGWYVNDYGKGKSSTSNAENGQSASEDNSATKARPEVKSEAKSEAKTETNSSKPEAKKESVASESKAS